eukprot:5209426-Alexandrium_andersonii.AAC.1
MRAPPRRRPSLRPTARIAARVPSIRALCWARMPLPAAARRLRPCCDARAFICIVTVLGRARPPAARCHSRSPLPQR